jgi:hypothetical protein
MLVVLRVKESPPFSWGIFILSASSLPSGMVFRFLFVLLSLLITGKVFTQTLGGSSTYNFLKLQQVPKAAASGGRNVSDRTGGIGMLTENPALLQREHHQHIATHFTLLAPGITGLYGLAGFHEKRTKTDLALGISHLMYGEEEQTDAGGNITGVFKAYDQMVGITVSRNYGERWRYGITLKGINSRYGFFSSTGLAADAGISYQDTARNFQVGFSAKNMGSQLKTYNGQGEDLPFDMVLGITQKLDKAPLRFSLTAQRLNRFDILYNDTSFNAESYGRAGLAGWGDKLISHLILGTDILLGEKITISAGYNFLRRKELSFSNIASGLTGFSYGMSLQLSKFNFQYGRAHFQSGLSHHLISLQLRMGKYTSD